jgi:hypothetical protein
MLELPQDVELKTRQQIAFFVLCKGEGPSHFCIVNDVEMTARQNCAGC